jgi:hypothetical protein
VIDTSTPFCLVLGVVLDWVESARAAPVMATFRAMSAGSYLIVSIGMNDHDPGLAEDVTKAYHADQVHLNSPNEVAGYFEGLEMVPPGLVEARSWRPSHPQPTGRSAVSTVSRPSSAHPPGPQKMTKEALLLYARANYP